MGGSSFTGSLGLAGSPFSGFPRIKDFTPGGIASTRLLFSFFKSFSLWIALRRLNGFSISLTADLTSTMDFLRSKTTVFKSSPILFTLDLTSPISLSTFSILSTSLISSPSVSFVLVGSSVSSALTGSSFSFSLTGSSDSLPIRCTLFFRLFVRCTQRIFNSYEFTILIWN